MTGPREVPLYVVRQELHVAGKEPHALRQDLFKPDVMSGPARVVEQRRKDLLEQVEIRALFLPLGPAARVRHRRQVAGRARTLEQLLNGDGHSSGGGRGFVESFMAQARGGSGALARGGGKSSKGGGRSGSEGAQLEERVERARRAKRLAETSALFDLQLLLRTQSTVKGRAVQLMDMLEASLQVLNDGSRFAAVGRRIGVGDTTFWFWGVDASFLRRWWFDVRWDLRLFRPPRRSTVTSREVAGLMTPPTKFCDGPVVRSGGAVPAAPPELPDYGRPGVFPLGRVADTKGGTRLAGYYEVDSTFSAMSGASGAGKSQQLAVRALHVARRTTSGLFVLDPHRQTYDQIQDYLADQADRLVLVDVSPLAPRSVGWNPIDMTDVDHDDIEGRVKALLDALALVNRWESGPNNRALNLMGQALMSLATIGRRLSDRPDCQPTLFQVRTLLLEKEWRDTVMPYLEEPQRTFWKGEFQSPTMQRDGVPPVTHTLHRLRMSKAITAMLGQSHGFYDIRRFMDQGQIVLASTAAASKKDADLITAMLVFDLFRAAKSRIDLDEHARRKFWAFLDEAQTYDGDGTLAEILREVRKFGLAADQFNQEPKALSDQTLNAIATNAAHRVTGRLGIDDAKVVAEGWGKNGTKFVVEPTTITRLRTHRPARDDQPERKPKYIGTFTVNGERTAPFEFTGVGVDDLFADHRQPALRRRLEEVVDKRTRRKTPAQVEQALADLDERILDALASTGVGQAAWSGRRGTIAPTSSPGDPDDLTY